MDAQLFIIFVLTFTIHFVGTVALSFRLAGVQTAKIAIAMALFNVLTLVTRTSNSFQAPFLAKRVEDHIAGLAVHDLSWDFRIVLLSATLGSAVGIALLPSSRAWAVTAINRFSKNRSVPGLLLSAMTLRGIGVMLSAATRPRLKTVTDQGLLSEMPVKLVLLAAIAHAFWTVGVIASIYAGSMEPEFRVTASTLSSVINGFATIALYMIVDPFLAGLMDDVSQGKEPQTRLKRAIIWMAGAKLIGTLFAQVVFVPGAYLIAYLARLF